MTKLPYTTPSIDDQMGLEKMPYMRFYMANVVRRPAEVPHFFVPWSSLQLPNDSVVHTVRDFDTLRVDGNVSGDLDLPVIVNEKFPIYLKVTNHLPGDETKPLPVSDSFTYRPSQFLGQITDFFQKNHRIHRILSDRTLGKMESILSWVDYSTLKEMTVNGVLADYRKFDIIFRTILDQISVIGGSRHHYIVLPQSGAVYPKTKLQKAFGHLWTDTLAPFGDDASIYPIIHLLGCIYALTNKVKVTPWRLDEKLWKHEKVEPPELTSTSLFSRMPEELMGNINLILYRGDRAIVYNMADLLTFGKDPSFYQKLYRHVMALRMSSSAVEDTAEHSDEHFDKIVDTLHAGADTSSPEPAQGTQESTTEDSTSTTPEGPPGEAKPIYGHPDELVSPQPESSLAVKPPATQIEPLETTLRRRATEATAAEVQSDTKRQQKLQGLMENHFKVKFDGKPLGSYLGSGTATAIEAKNLDFLTDLPMEGYKRSSLSALDKGYMERGFTQEHAKVLASLASHGMFVSKVESTVTDTTMDRYTEYRVQCADINGKTHTIRYRLPTVDDKGEMKLGGVTYAMTRQIVNVPICKISPSRVSLSSYYGKFLVERVTSVRRSFERYIINYIYKLRDRGMITTVSGITKPGEAMLPYDYSAIASKVSEIIIGDYTIHFGGSQWYPEGADKDTIRKIDAAASDYGHFCGVSSRGGWIFWDHANTIRVLEKGKVVNSYQSFFSMCEDILGPKAYPDTSVGGEWTEMRIMRKSIPLGIALGYRLGLRKLLSLIRLKYAFYPNGVEFTPAIDDVVVRFRDGYMVFPRYPITKSFIASGLCWADLKKYSFSEMDTQSTYIKIMMDKKITPMVLRAIDGQFDYFMDPITLSILQKMREPTNFTDLLLRASAMLTTYGAKESTSIELHRFRRYERFNGILYGQIYTELARYRNNAMTRKSFSINPEAVFLNIVNDATISPVNTINPIHEAKGNTQFTFTGADGRSSASMVNKDRVYSKDAIGVISEATPDSSKVGITAYLSANPRIDDIHGLPIPFKDGDENTLDASQIMSIAGMVMAGVTTDDGKRANYSAIQASHVVPNVEDGETLAVRTGYDQVLPHLVSDTFASVADEDGVVTEIDEKNKVIKVKYANTVMPTLRSERIPISTSQIDADHKLGTRFGILIVSDDIGKYPLGGVLSLTKTTNGEIVDRILCNKVDDIPDPDVVHRQPQLVAQLSRRKIPALYYIEFIPTAKTIPGKVKAYGFSDQYTAVSGSYLLQTRVANVKEGEKIKRGDVLVYNPGFFAPDPDTKQVTFKHGVLANVALVEKSTNHEDAAEISRDFSRRLKMTPCHKRQVVLNHDSEILQIVKLGDHVETTDPVCVIADAWLVQTSGSLNPENLDIFEKLNRQTPTAGDNGLIVQINVLYGGKKEDLSESLRDVLREYERRVRKAWTAENTDPKAKPPAAPGYVLPGTKYQGVDFTTDTVILEFMIQETIDVLEGDKICVANANKSIAAYVSDGQHYTESGIPVDILFSTTGVINRIVRSPFNGITERVCDELKRQVVEDFDFVD